jgi:acylphosphatase
MIGNALAIADSGNNRVMVWVEMPTVADAPCDLVLGQSDTSASEHNCARYAPNVTSLDMPYGCAVLNGSLIVADIANSRLVGFAGADVATGAAADRLTAGPISGRRVTIDGPLRCAKACAGPVASRRVARPPSSPIPATPCLLVGGRAMNRMLPDTATEIRVRGIVRNVGFRPTVYRLATRMGFHGEVLNDSEGILIRVMAYRDEAERLVAAIAAERPPLARIDSVDFRRSDPLPSFDGFSIVENQVGGMNEYSGRARTATCPACLAEIEDPIARRFRYPFTNCTHRGPRLTIICDAPYDRERTTMASFGMCDACRAEYEDPTTGASMRCRYRLHHRRSSGGGLHRRLGSDPCRIRDE